MDSPVVVIGSSLTFKVGAKDKNAVWKEIKKGQTYQTVPASAILEIALKTTAVPDSDDNHRDDDDNETTDQQRVIVPIPIDPASQTFQITVYAVGLGAVASITGDGTTISLQNLIEGATLCPTSKRRLDYSSDGACTNSDQFDKVEVTTGTGANATVTPITCILNPTISNPTPCLGKCRIVLRCNDAGHKALREHHS